MIVDARTLAIGSYSPASITIALCGGPTVDTIWALSLMAVRVPFDARWIIERYEGPVERAKAEALADWLVAGDTDRLLIWPAGQHLAWHTVFTATRNGALPMQIEAAALHVRNDEHTPAERPDLAAPGLDGHAAEADGRIDPAVSVAVLVPTLGRCSMAFAAACLGLCPPVGVFAYLRAVVGFPVDEARTRLVDSVLAMQPRPDWAFFLGDDMIAPSNLVHALWDTAHGLDLPAVGAVYTNKVDPPQVLAWRGQRTVRPKLDYTDGDVIEVDGMGLDACLLRTDVLATVPAPRFRTVQADDDSLSLTEDVWFWRAWREATGRRPFLATGIVVPHLDGRTGRAYVAGGCVFQSNA